MPGTMTSQKLQTGAQARMPHSSSSSVSSRNEDASVGMPETPTRRTLQKKQPTNPAPASQTPLRGTTTRNANDSRSTYTHGRRLSIRERSATVTNRTNTSTARTTGNATRERLQTGKSSRPSSNASTSTFGTSSLGSGRDDKHTPPEAADFLPQINFDDFHNSLTSGEPSLSHFPVPGRGGNPSSGRAAGSRPNARGEISVQPPQRDRDREYRTANTARRTEVNGAAASMAPPPPPAQRTRRQSFVPPQSSTAVNARPPRKSIGPGMVVPDGPLNPSTRRKPSISRKRQADEQDSDNTTFSSRPDAQNHLYLTTAREQKAMSLQPPARTGTENLMAPTSASEASRSSPSNHVRTPVKGSFNRTTTPSSSSSKRISVMPAHATGLGARTISPTDARRLKRMSLIPQPPPLPRASPTLLDLGFPRPGSTAQSPSMIPRKSVTPSSTRTTPDPHRKSYSSGISLSSNASSGSARNSNGSLQVRLSQNYSSRLPAPKPRHENASGGADEDVPPVPAIPKAYESPKADTDHPGFTSRKSSLALDSATSSQPSKEDSQGVRAGQPSDDNSQTPRARGGYGKQQPVNFNRKNLQPLKLPPLNLMPLSGPVATKINALRDRDPVAVSSSAPESPPPRYRAPKTPSTPMTASKANFFNLPFHEHPISRPMTQTRSNSSIFTERAVSTVFRAEHSSSALDTIPLHQDRTASPYVTASTPKGPVWDFLNTTPSVEVSRPLGNKLTGPRPQTHVATYSPLPSTIRHVSHGAAPRADVPPSPRKTSLEHKRTTTHGHAPSETTAQEKSAHDNMPPPKLPASATWANITSAPRSSPTASTLNYIHVRRRPSVSHGPASSAVPRRNQSISSEQNVPVNASPSTDSGETDNQSNRSSSSIFSPVHKLVSGSRSSPGPKNRPNESNLDKDDLIAEEQMRKLGSRRRDFENAAKELAELGRRATPKERVTPAQALKVANLNIFEKGEIIDFKDIYFCGTHKAKKHVGDLNSQSANFGYDDERGDYNIVVGDHIAYRYEIVDVLGKGSFGQVVRCVDHKTGQLVAVKIIRNKKRFHQQALVEVNILKKLKEWDPHQRHSVVNFTQNFYFRGHLCISTELLGMNLYELIKAYDFKGFSTKIIRRFTKQILGALVLLHNKNVVHCDLKPENILLVHPLRAEIKVIDFGSSCFENEKVYTYIQSRFYRSPEVILGMSYGMPIDMWSLGCILAELYTGYPIFPGENEQEQLACIMEIFGPPEKHLIEKSTRKKLFFDSQGKPRLTVSSKGRRRKPSSKDLRQALKCDDEVFLDFIARCLRWDPARRLNPHDAFNHEFISGIKPTFRSRTHTLSNSPGPKRLTSGSGSLTSNRPLPDPPPTNLKPSGHRAGNSPVKMGPGKRHSTLSNSISGPVPVKRNTNNAPPPASSALPRVARRSVSGKPDLAAVAAAASLKSRV